MTTVLAPVAASASSEANAVALPYPLAVQSTIVMPRTGGANPWTGPVGSVEQSTVAISRAAATRPFAQDAPPVSRMRVGPPRFARSSTRRGRSRRPRLGGGAHERDDQRVIASL